MFLFATIFSVALNIKIDNKIKEAVEFTKENVPYFEVPRTPKHRYIIPGTLMVMRASGRPSAPSFD